MSIRNIYAEELPRDIIESTKFCPSVSMINNYDEDGNIITKLINGVFTISGDNYRQYTGFSFEDIQPCQTDFFSNSDASGCCIIKGINDELGDNYKDHNMGYKYYFDISGTNNDGSYNIYHKEPVQTLFSFLDDPNKIKTFFILIIISIFLILILAIIGSCYEFWLRYGNSIKCLYYIGKCKNIGDESKSGQAGKVNLIDYMFPNSIAYYPYQKCETTSQLGGKQLGGKQSGGKKQKGGGLLDSLEEKERIGFHSNYVSYKKANDGTTAKCITIDNSQYDNKGRPFPYNIADFDIESKSIKLILKFICFFFLFPVLITRIILNKCLSFLSSAFQKNVRNNPIISNIIFAFFIGAIPINIGGLAILSFIITLIGGITPMIGIITTLILTIIPNKIGPFRKALQNYNDGEVTTEYYSLLNELYGYFYSISNVIELKDKIKNFFWNVLWFIPYLICISFGLTFGVTSTLAATIYMIVSTIFNFFYIPLSNSIELLDILKDHSSLLTVLLCITVATSSAFALDATTTSILSSLIAILILYKVLTYNKK